MLETFDQKHLYEYDNTAVYCILSKVVQVQYSPKIKRQGHQACLMNSTMNPKKER